MHNRTIDPTQSPWRPYRHGAAQDRVTRCRFCLGQYAGAVPVARAYSSDDTDGHFEWCDWLATYRVYTEAQSVG